MTEAYDRRGRTVVGSDDDKIGKIDEICGPTTDDAMTRPVSFEGRSSGG